MNKWEEFSKEDAEYYILTSNPYSFDEKSGKHFFFSSGEKFVEESFKQVEDLIPTRERVLEIGCGVGRLLIPHSKLFAEAVGVDIASGMLKKLEENCREKNIANIKGLTPFEDWHKLKYDYVYSFIVMQHIEDYSIIKNYLLKVADALKPGGVSQLQFDTRPKTIAYKFRNSLPDFILPKAQRTGIRRIRRNGNELKKIFKENNLTVINELNRNTELHTFILQK